MRRALWTLPLFGLAVGCSGAEPDELRVSRASSAVIGGRVSTAEENRSIMVVTTGDVDQSVCSGTLLAPNLVATARHCILVKKGHRYPCNSEGELVDPSNPEGQDVRHERADRVVVYFGADKASFTSVKAKQIVSTDEISLCRGDVAFLVLESPIADVYTPLRLGPVRPGERMSFSGWGYRDDDKTELPSARYTIEGVRIEEVGPGFIPLDTFAVAGNTMCAGDSGGGALIDGAVAGVYSRIEGGGSCELSTGRNVFVTLSRYTRVVERAFAAAGATVWREGETPPWAKSDGSACAADAACRSGVCRDGTCAALCGTAPPCAADQICREGACVAAAPSAAASPEESSGCRLTPDATRRGRPSQLAVAGLAALVLGAWARRRRALRAD